jgi:TetR/AcrR family transcriptional regulator
MDNFNNNRDKILQKALALFAARGYDAVGVQEIVEAAGVTKPTLYHYFGNKQGLLETLLTRYFEQFYSQLEVAASYNGDLPLTLDQLIKAYFDFARANPLFYRLQLGLWFAPPDSEAYQIVMRLNEKQYHLIEEMFRQAAQDHGNMRGRHQAYAVTFIGMVNNYIGLALNGYTQLDDKLRHQAAHQFLYGIFS